MTRFPWLHLAIVLLADVLFAVIVGSITDLPAWMNFLVGVIFGVIAYWVIAGRAVAEWLLEREAR